MKKKTVNKVIWVGVAIGATYVLFRMYYAQVKRLKALQDKDVDYNEKQYDSEGNLIYDPDVSVPWKLGLPETMFLG